MQEPSLPCQMTSDVVRALFRGLLNRLRQGVHCSRFCVKGFEWCFLHAGIVVKMFAGKNAACHRNNTASDVQR